MLDSNDSKPPRNHLVGWMAISGEAAAGEMRKKIDAGLQSFVGDYGLGKEIMAAKGFGFGLWKPGNPLPLNTWSLFKKQGKTCFIEGVFYDDVFSHRPLKGEDKELAEIFCRKFEELGYKAIEKLNGSFSGFIFDHEAKRLITFIDRLGVHVLYWSYEKGNVAVSSNLAGFRGLKTLSLDQNAAFQFLTIGFPIGERTLLTDVMIQSPCTANIYEGSSRQSVRYWDVPKRMNGISLTESVEMINQSVEEHVSRIYDRTGQAVSLGVTGGHDSRVVLSALAYRNVPFELALWRDNNFNDEVTAKLCAVFNKQPIIVRNVTDEEMEAIQKNVFAYTDGNYMYSHGFVRLARECFEREHSCLMLGYSGDRISGSLTIPAPQYLKSLEQLAASSLKNQMELLSFKDAQGLMRNTREDIIDETLSEWRKSFVKESAHEHLSDVSIWQGFANRNLKRIRFSMVPAQQYVQPIFPYLDNNVMVAYMSMPIKHLNNQKAHCYAGFHRFHNLGRYQACSYPVPLKTEARFPFALYLVRSGRSKVRDVFTSLRSASRDGKWSDALYKVHDELLRSPLFDSGALRELFLKRRIQPRDLHKIHTLSRFHDFYICGDNACIPKAFFAGRPDDSSRAAMDDVRHV